MPPAHRHRGDGGIAAAAALPVYRLLRYTFIAANKFRSCAGTTFLMGLCVIVSRDVQPRVCYR